MHSTRSDSSVRATFCTYVALVGAKSRIRSRRSRSSASPASSDARVERGAHLVRTMGCNDCHTPWKMGPRGPEPDMSRALTGHPEDLVMPPAPALPPGPWTWIGAATNTAFAGPWGVSFTANLTPDPETGLGKWTEAMFIQTMKTGRHEGKGRHLLPPMPYPIIARAERRGHQVALRVSAVAAAGAQSRAAADRSARRLGSDVGRSVARELGARGLAMSGSAICVGTLVIVTAAVVAIAGGARERVSAAESTCALPHASARRALSCPARRASSTSATGCSRRNTRCGRTARSRRAGCSCRRARRSTRATTARGTFPWARGSGRSSAFNGRKVETRMLWKATAPRVGRRELSLERRADRRDARLGLSASLMSRRCRRTVATAFRRRAIASPVTARSAPNRSASTRCSSRPIAIPTRSMPNRSPPDAVTLRTLVTNDPLSPTRTDLVDAPPRIRTTSEPQRGPCSDTLPATAADATAAMARSLSRCRR